MSQRATFALVTIVFSVVVGALTAFFGLHRVNVEAGQEAVLTDKPFLIGTGGVQPEALSTGSKWFYWTTTANYYSLLPEQKTETFDDERDGTITSDNIPIDFNAYIKVRVVAGKTPLLHAKFGSNWYVQNLQQVFRTAVRDQVSKATMTSLTTRQLNVEGKEMLEIMQLAVRDEMREFVKKEGIFVEVMEVIIGKATPPKRTLDALAETASQQQRFKTETERARAETEREKAERNRAVADNAYRNSLGYSPEQYLRLELAKKHIEAVQACAGKSNCTIIVGELGGATPTLPLK